MPAAKQETIPNHDPNLALIAIPVIDPLSYTIYPVVAWKIGSHRLIAITLDGSQEASPEVKDGRVFLIYDKAAKKALLNGDWIPVKSVPASLANLDHSEKPKTAPTKDLEDDALQTEAED